MNYNFIFYLMFFCDDKNDFRNLELIFNWFCSFFVYIMFWVIGKINIKKIIKYKILDIINRRNFFYMN